MMDLVSRPRFVASLAISLDGYIADADGGVGWLDAYHTPEIDWEAFMSRFGATILGRATYDQSVAAGWPVGSGQPAIVLTHRPLEAKRVEAYDGELKALCDSLAQRLEGSGKDVWLMGGGQMLRGFRDQDLVDAWELAVMPMILGQGIPLFVPGGAPQRMALTQCRSLGNGIVELRYERDGK